MEMIKSNQFIEEWMHHFNLYYERDIVLLKNIKVDYYLPKYNFAILIYEWKKPLSVTVINRAYALIRNSRVNELYIITNTIGEYAAKVANKLSDNITILKNNELSELAIKLASMNRSIYASAIEQ